MLKYIAISGTTSVTHNMYVYETEKEMLVVDCGVGFPDLNTRGVDLIIPDFSYVVKNKNKLVGLLLSHGHEDHVGATPYLLREANVPVWSTKLVSAFLEDKLSDAGIGNAKLNVFNELADEFDIGSFHVNSFRTTHSIPETQGFAIDTPEGRVFHIPEHKIDQEPVVGKAFDAERIKALAAKGALFLASDSLRSNVPGITPKETQIEDNLEKVAKDAQGAIFFTAISSNIGRFKQAMSVAKKLRRKICFIGFSIKRKCMIARDLNYLDFDDNFELHFKEALKKDKREMFYIVGGCFGQPGSSLERLSNNDHFKAKVEKGDMVIISQDPAPPYTKEAQNAMVDNFFDMGADVHYYELDDGLYVSGHGSQGDIVKLFDLVKPKYISPVGGTIRFMKGYTKLAQANGFEKDRIFELKPGENIEFSRGSAKRGEKVQVRPVYVDGTGIGDVGRVVLQERETLSKGGVVVAVVRLRNGKVSELPEIFTKGFVFEKINKKLLQEASRLLDKKLRDTSKRDKRSLSAVTEEALGQYMFSRLERRPLIIPVVLEN